MQKESYFKRVHKHTQTRFWINNPTDKEAELAISHGAVHCTTNPAYVSKMLESGEMRDKVLGWITESLKESQDIKRAAVLVQRKAVGNLTEHFLPLYNKMPRRMGYVSLQGDPFAEDNPESIISEALECGATGRPNYIAKIPATKAGLIAADTLIRQDIPVIATEIMSVSQTVSACETYIKASEESGKKPPFFVTSIAGIFDESLRGKYGSDIEGDILYQAGVTLTRRQYRVMYERGYPGILLGGGARGLHHFTELVGGNLHVTINWKGSAETLIEKDEPVICRMNTPVPEYVTDTLMRLPDFRKAYLEDGLTEDEYAEFAPVRLFRDMFIDGWNKLLDEIRSVQEGG